MFQYLTKEWWDEFSKTIIDSKSGEPKKIRDGEKFEKLIELLLKEMYKSKNIVWEPTPTTHDGSKDFRAYDSNGKLLPIWAECKNHSKKIELKSISPTIVMAEINDISEILFFSYSPINKNTKEKLTLYANKSNKKIMFFDDVNLEKLIFTYSNVVFKEFFKKFKFPPKKYFDVQPDIFLKYGKGINPTADNNFQAKRLYIKLNDIIYVGIGIINNLSDEGLHISIDFAELNDINYIEYLDSDIKRSDSTTIKIEDMIEPGRACFYPLFFKIVIYKKKLLFPQIKVQYQSSYINEQKIIDVPEVWCSKLYVTSLMGSQYRKFVEEFEKEHLGLFHFELCVIEGKSGVGKTRMLYELITVLLKNHYQILNFSGINGDISSIQVIREIIYSLYNLSEDLIIESLKEPHHYKATYGDDTLQILQILQGLTINTDLSFLEKNKVFVFEKILNTRVGILIDNIQYFDNILINFIKDLYLYAKNINRESHAILIITHNTDYAVPNALTDLFCVAFLHKNNFHVSSKKYLLEGFKCEEPEQALGYLKAIVSVHDHSLDTQLNKIVSITSGNPKYILEIIEYFEQKKILGFQNGLLIVRDYKKFSEELGNIPNEVENVIAKRWNLVKQIMAKHIDELYLILSAVHFWRNCNNSILESLLLDIKLAEYLTRYGFLYATTENNFQYFDFEHDLIENYFVKDKNFNFLIIHYVVNNNLFAELFPYCSEWQRHIIESYHPANLTNTLDAMVQGITFHHIEVPFKWGITYYIYIIRYLLKNYKIYSKKEQIIGALKMICLYIKNTYGTSVAFVQYKYIYNFLERELDDNRYLNRAYLQFIDGYTENLLHMGYKDIIDIYDKQIDVLKYHSKEYPDVLGMLYNRKYVYYKNKRPEEEVHKYFVFCQKICEKYNLKELKMLNLFDAGNYYLYDEKNIDKLKHYWENAIGIYEIEKFKDAFLFTTKKKIQLCLIKKDYKNISNNLDEVKRYFLYDKQMQEQTLFFQKYFSVLKAIYYEINNIYNDELTVELSQALDYNVLMNNKELFNIYYLYAKMFFYKKDYANMILYYELGLDNLEEHFYLYLKDYFKKVIFDDLKYKLLQLYYKKIVLESKMFKREDTLGIWNHIKTYDENTLLKLISDFKTRSTIASPDGKDGYLF